jgi:hypothetical protein
MASSPDDFWTSSRVLSFLLLYLMAQACSLQHCGKLPGSIEIFQMKTKRYSPFYVHVAVFRHIHLAILNVARAAQ